MPFKSKAQRRKFAELLLDGKITDEQYEEWNRSTGRRVLPERLHQLTEGASKKSQTKRTPAKSKTKRVPKETQRRSSRAK